MDACAAAHVDDVQDLLSGEDGEFVEDDVDFLAVALQQFLRHRRFQVIDDETAKGLRHGGKLQRRQAEIGDAVGFERLLKRQSRLAFLYLKQRAYLRGREVADFRRQAGDAVNGVVLIAQLVHEFLRVRNGFFVRTDKGLQFLQVEVFGEGRHVAGNFAGVHDLEHALQITFAELFVVLFAPFA